MSGPGAQTRAGVQVTETHATRRDPPALRRYSWALLAAGLAGGSAAALAGSPVPPVLPTLALVALVAVATNRIALFPSEWSSTAEATVLVAAIVVFAPDAAVLGPWVVALACGPLDVVHWRERAYSRIAYNSGNRMLSTLAATLAFAAGESAGIDPAAVGFALAALTASVVFAATELVGFVGVEWFRHHVPARVAVRDDLFFDSLTIPLGMLGAAAGWLAAAVGWWAAVPVVVPALALPELLLVRARRAWPGLASRRVVVGAVCVLSVAAALALVAACAPFPDGVTFACLLAVAVLLALELRVSRRAPVAPLVAVGLVAAWLLAPESTLAAAVAVAVVATATACMLEPAAVWWAPAVAAGAAAIATVAFALSPTRGGAVVAAVVFELMVSTRRAVLVWTVPVVCCAVAFASVPSALGDGALPAFGAALVVLGVVSSTWGATPWDSRLLRRRQTRGAATHRVTLVVIVATSAVCGVLAATPIGHRPGWIAAASGAAATAIATIAVGARQWRFAPRRRRTDAAILVVVGLVTVLAYPALALGREAGALGALVGVLATVVVLGWPTARLADAAAANRGGTLR